MSDANSTFPNCQTGREFSQSYNFIDTKLLYMVENMNSDMSSKRWSPTLVGQVGLS